MALGRSGNFRRLGIPGEDLDKVSNRLHDPADHAEQHCLVVGGGDSAVETALALEQSGADVTLAYRGDAFWKAHGEGVWSKELVEAALCRTIGLGQARDGFNHVYPTIDEMHHLVKDPWAYQYEHRDGLRCTMIALNGLAGGSWSFAARLKGREEPLSTYMHLPMPPGLANFFSPLVNNIEQMFSTGKAAYPIERTLLTTGLTAAGLESLHGDQQRVETPHLDIAYQPSAESTHWRT